jgi:hypothetical protein
MAVATSDWIRSRSDTGMAPRAGGGQDPWPPERPGVACLSNLAPAAWPAIGSTDRCSGVLLALCFLALSLHARLLVVLAPASLGEDAALLDLLVEATQCALERLVLTHSDFCQSRFTSQGQGLVFSHRARGQPARHDLDRWFRSRARRSADRLAEHSGCPIGGQPRSIALARPVSRLPHLPEARASRLRSTG